MSFILKNRAFHAAMFTMFLSVLVVSCGQKTGNQNPNVGPVTAKPTTTPPAASSGLPLTGTWISNCFNDSTYTMVIPASGMSLTWTETKFTAGMNCDEEAGNPNPQPPVTYLYSYYNIGSITNPPGATPFNFYSPDGTYVELNFVIYNQQNNSLQMGNWDEYLDGTIPDQVGPTFTLNGATLTN